jgi:UDPglucose--hexose-1-phosphate uridylyltransferase
VSERRRDPLTGEWRTFAAQRQDRTFLPPEDHCPLCPTVGGQVAGFPTEVPRTGYDLVVFDNRFPALSPDPPLPSVPPSRLYLVEPALGASEVVLYTSDHHSSMSEMSLAQVEKVIGVWADRYAELGAREEVAYVFVFENKGEVVGVTLHHPHGQIYAYPEIPPIPRRELDLAQAHLRDHGTCVVCDVVARERADGVRIVDQNRSFVAFVPFAARFPYEVHVTARRHAASLLDLTDPERAALAALLSAVVKGYDRLFGFSLPYVMSMHQAPTDDGQWQPVSHLHLEFTPLHRTATKLKYLAGSELGAGAFINDTLPERTADELRAALGHHP